MLSRWEFRLREPNSLLFPKLEQEKAFLALMSKLRRVSRLFVLLLTRVKE